MVFHVGIFNGLQKGPGQGARIGDKVRFTSINVSGQVFMYDASGKLGIDIGVRIMLVSFKRPRGSAFLTYFE